MASSNSSSNPDTEGGSIARLLDRPAGERAREYKYRLAQSLVFGLPVIGLQIWGPKLGGAEAGRWIAVFQAILAGWVVYVGAAGVLFEAMLWAARGRFSVALITSGGAVGIYVYSLIGAAAILFTGNAAWRPLMFHWAVGLIAVWSAIQWWNLSRLGALSREA